MSITIRKLGADEARSSRDGLAALLADGVDGGASISFMWPFSQADAAAWWDGVVEEVAEGRVVLFVALDAERIIGSVQLAYAPQPNQPHRADIRKLLVHRGARRQGVGERLLLAVEQEARHTGRTLLVLDTVAGSDADRLYRRTGWVAAGTIPNYALWPDGRFCDATVFWKAL